MRQYLIMSVLGVVLSCSVAFAQNMESCMAILMPGQVQDADLDDFDFPPKGWLALVVKNDHWELVPTKVNIGNETVSSTQPKALALLHDRRLAEGEIKTPNMKFSGDRRTMSSNSPSLTKINFLGTEYRLGISKSGTIALTNGKITTILDTDRDDASLVWAGDLDKDGRLDLIVQSGTEKQASYCLYLSGPSHGGALVKKIGCQYHSG